MVRGRHLATKRLSRVPRSGSGGKGPRTVAKFKLLKRFKVLESESIFKKYQHFLARKINFFNENFRKNEDSKQRFVNFSEKLFYKFQILWSISKLFLLSG